MPSRGTTSAKAPREESEKQYGGNHMPKMNETLVSYCRHGQLDSAGPLSWVKWSLYTFLEPKRDRIRLHLHQLTLAAL